MDAPQLYDLMHGISIDSNKTVLPKKPKDRFEKACDASIKKEVDLRLSLLDQRNQLVPLNTRHAKVEQEIRETIDCTPLSQQVTTAVTLLRDEGQIYLKKEDYEALMLDIRNLGFKMDSLDLDHLDAKQLKSAFTISAANLAALQQIGITKFSEKYFLESLAIFTFLTVLEPEQANYWYRLGLVAQKCEQYELALRAHAVVSELAPDFIGTRIFASQCYIEIQQLDQALIELNAAKNISKTVTVEAEWHKRIVDIEKLLAYADSIRRHK
jgi:tetratricopeptide (TPR) repeat protein